LFLPTIVLVGELKNYLFWANKYVLKSINNNCHEIGKKNLHPHCQDQKKNAMMKIKVLVYKEN
jgi:hypothetical protein